MTPVRILEGSCYKLINLTKSFNIVKTSKCGVRQSIPCLINDLKTQMLCAQLSSTLDFSYKILCNSRERNKGIIQTL